MPKKKLMSYSGSSKIISVCETRMGAAKECSSTQRSWCLLLGLPSCPHHSRFKNKLQRGGSFHPCNVCSQPALHEHSWSLWARPVRATWPWFAMSPWCCAVLVCCCSRSAVDVVCHLQGRAARLLSEHWTRMTHMQPRKGRWVRNGRQSEK